MPYKVRTPRAILLPGGILLALLLLPAQAQAQGFVSLNVGRSFGGGLDGPKTTYGATLGLLGGGIGLELDAGYSPDFFEPEEDDLNLVSDSSLFTANANLIVGALRGNGLRPYGSGGLSVMRSSVDSLADLRVTGTDLGLNVGAGVMGFFSSGLGVRGDVRYYRSLADQAGDDAFDFTLGEFDFWRASVGLVFRFGA